ncbi:taste receptor type 2 member 7-like [Pelodiscus sinensis]|uniref:taste receptor type 2 member 7-like n=1 Tax=Pelodiscus sinensis TaxID=13735 RepID=UPI003F6C60A0
MFSFIISLIILGMELIVGVIANGLMVVVNCLEWIRSRNLTCCDMILTSLGISRLFFQCMIIINTTIYQISSEDNTHLDLLRTLDFLWCFTSTLSLWFASLLSVFYCAKIANFSQTVFLCLKWRLLGLIPQLLMGTYLVSFFTSLASVYSIDRKYVNNSVINLSGKTTGEWTFYTNISSGLFILYMLSHSFPFIIFIVSSALLITSQWRHTKRKEKNTGSYRDTVTQVHVRAIQGQFSFIIFHISYFVAQVILFIGFFAESLSNSMWCLVIMVAYASVHFVILVLGNSKLKKVAVRALHCARCRLRDEVS